MQELTDVIEQYNTFKQQRLSMERMAADLKVKEKELENTIILSLTTMNVEGMKLPTGTVGLRHTTGFLVSDAERVCWHMYRGFQDAIQRGTPLSDALLLQKTPHKQMLIEQICNKRGVDELDSLDRNTITQEAMDFGCNVTFRTNVTFSSKR